MIFMRIKDQESMIHWCIPKNNARYITWEVRDDGGVLRSERGKPKGRPKAKGGRISGDLQARRRDKLESARQKFLAGTARERRDAWLLNLAETGRFVWSCPDIQEVYDRAFGNVTIDETVSVEAKRLAHRARKRAEKRARARANRVKKA